MSYVWGRIPIICLWRFRRRRFAILWDQWCRRLASNSYALQKLISSRTSFFFNAQEHEPYAGEDRLMVESPKVANFADAPEMSADKITETVLKNIDDGNYGLIVMNYANPDLVGHGGKLDAAVKACGDRRPQSP